MRRFFQFSLRTALVFVTLCSFAFAWFGANLREWQVEQGAINALGSAAVEHSSSHILPIPIFL